MRTATFCPSSVTRSVFFSFGPSLSAAVCSQATGAVATILPRTLRATVNMPLGEITA